MENDSMFVFSEDKSRCLLHTEELQRQAPCAGVTVAARGHCLIQIAIVQINVLLSGPLSPGSCCELFFSCCERENIVNKDSF